MSSIVTICKRELHSFYFSLTAYIVVALFLLISGWLFWPTVFESQVLTMRPFFAVAPLFLTFFAPAVTMGIFAEERKLGTIELLVTMPVSEAEIIIGKYVAALILLSSIFVMTLPYALTLATLGPLDWGPVIGGYVGLLLLGSAYAAIGMMVSSWTSDQIISVLVSFFICFTFYFLDKMLTFLPPSLASFIQYLGTDYHFQNIAKGVIDIRDVTYYLSVSAIALGITKLTLESRKW